MAGNGDRPLRILFFAENPVAFWRYASLVHELGRRGHRTHLAFKRVPEDLIDTLVGGVPGVTTGVAPRWGRFDGWGRVRWIVRRLTDLARYTYPKYAGAYVLRDRMAHQVIGRLEGHDFEPFARAVARRLARRLAPGDDWALGSRVIDTAARLERAIPTCGAVDDYIREQAPDVVLVTPVVKGPEQLDFLKSAQRLGVPAAACIRSWDQLTNKGLLKWTPQRVFVWNEIQRGEAVEMHGIPADRVVATGAQVFDEWFERRPSTSSAEFASRVGLNPAQPYILFLGSTLDITRIKDLEVEFVRAWLKALRESGDAGMSEIGVMVRPHPNRSSAEQWDGVDLSEFGNAVVWPRGGARPVAEDARAEFFDSLAHSKAVVGVNTTAMIEAAIVGRPVLTILESRFAQESTLHFHHLLAENGGFLSVAPELPEHLEQLREALGEDEGGEERRRAWVRSFVRPHGLDRPATPLLADAVEELATVPVEPPEPAGAWLRALLSVDAALNSVALVVNVVLAPVRRLHVGRRAQRFGRRVTGKARRHGLLPLRSAGL